MHEHALMLFASTVDSFLRLPSLALTSLTTGDSLFLRLPSFALTSFTSGDSLFLRLLPQYGYFAVLFAAFWEGEAVLIAAGTLCGAGYLDWRLTILAATVGGAAGDQIYFYAAHDRAARLVQKSKRLRKWYPHVSKFVLRHGTIAVLLSRFAAGLRITIPLVCATVRMPARKYSTLNLLSALFWSSTWVAISYQFGSRL